MKKSIAIGILALVILVLFIGGVYILLGHSRSVSTTSPSSLPTTVPAHVLLPYPPGSIGNFTYALTTPFPMYITPSISHGYMAGDIYIYTYSQNVMTLRFLAYSSTGAAFNSYKNITTNTLLTSTAISIPSLPVNYSGIKISQAGTAIYSISGLYMANVLTATMEQPSNSSMTTSNVTSFLLNALQQLIKSPT